MSFGDWYVECGSVLQKQEWDFCFDSAYFTSFSHAPCSRSVAASVTPTTGLTTSPSMPVPTPFAKPAKPPLSAPFRGFLIKPETPSVRPLASEPPADPIPSSTSLFSPFESFHPGKGEMCQDLLFLSFHVRHPSHVNSDFQCHPTGETGRVKRSHCGPQVSHLEHWGNTCRSKH